MKFVNCELYLKTTFPETFYWFAPDLFLSTILLSTLNVCHDFIRSSSDEGLVEINPFSTNETNDMFQAEIYYQMSIPNV